MLLSACFISLVADVFVYFEIRQIIWSIVRLDSAKSKNAYRKLKKSLKLDKTVSVSDRITMRHLGAYIKANESDFVLWRRIKTVFVMASLFMQIAAIAVYFFFNRNAPIAVQTVLLVNIGESCLIFLVLTLSMFTGNGRAYTRYDIERTKKRNGREK